MSLWTLPLVEGLTLRSAVPHMGMTLAVLLHVWELESERLAIRTTENQGDIWPRKFITTTGLR